MVFRDAEDDSGVLDCPAGVQQLRPHGADLRAQGVLQHPLQPIGSDDLRIVVDEGQGLTAGLARRVVVDGGVVERPVPMQKADAGETRQACVGFLGLGGDAAGVHQQNLPIGVVGGEEGFDAPAKQARLVLGRDDDRNQRPSHGVPDLLRPRGRPRPDLGADADPVEVLLHGPDVGGVVRRSRGPVVVKHQGNVANVVGFLGDAQRKVVRRGRAECGAKPADFADEAKVEGGEVSDVVRPRKVSGAQSGLKSGSRRPPRSSRASSSE